ncbi:hypothetical protein HK102_003333 [Quaeritorhiza haematococci]|nr:hypothetical protein HK102_003333 [Quaeritorhiza haematococci]
MGAIFFSRKRKGRIAVSAWVLATLGFAIVGWNFQSSFSPPTFPASSSAASFATSGQSDSSKTDALGRVTGEISVRLSSSSSGSEAEGGEAVMTQVEKAEVKSDQLRVHVEEGTVWFVGGIKGKTSQEDAAKTLGMEGTGRQVSEMVLKDLDRGDGKSGKSVTAAEKKSVESVKVVDGKDNAEWEDKSEERQDNKSQVELLPSSPKMEVVAHSEGENIGSNDQKYAGMQDGSARERPRPVEDPGAPSKKQGLPGTQISEVGDGKAHMRKESQSADSKHTVKPSSPPTNTNEKINLEEERIRSPFDDIPEKKMRTSGDDSGADVGEPSRWGSKMVLSGHNKHQGGKGHGRTKGNSGGEIGEPPKENKDFSLIGVGGNKEHSGREDPLMPSVVSPIREPKPDSLVPPSREDHDAEKLATKKDGDGLDVMTGEKEEVRWDQGNQHGYALPPDYEHIRPLLNGYTTQKPYINVRDLAALLRTVSAPLFSDDVAVHRASAPDVDDSLLLQQGEQQHQPHHKNPSPHKSNQQNDLSESQHHIGSPPSSSPSSPSPSDSLPPLTSDDLVFIIMGSSQNVDRVESQKQTWFKWARHYFVFADENNPDIPMRTLPELRGRTSYDDAQHRQLRGMQWLLSHRPELVKTKKWFILVDDDSWVNIPGMTAFLRAFDDNLPLAMGYVFENTQEYLDLHQTGARLTTDGDDNDESNSNSSDGDNDELNDDEDGGGGDTVDSDIAAADLGRDMLKARGQEGPILMKKKFGTPKSSHTSTPPKSTQKNDQDKMKASKIDVDKDVDVDIEKAAATLPLAGSINDETSTADPANPSKTRAHNPPPSSRPYHCGGAGIVLSRAAFNLITPALYTSTCPFRAANDQTLADCYTAMGVIMVDAKDHFSWLAPRDGEVGVRDASLEGPHSPFISSSTKTGQTEPEQNAGIPVERSNAKGDDPARRVNGGQREQKVLEQQHQRTTTPGSDARLPPRPPHLHDTDTASAGSIPKLPLQSKQSTKKPFQRQHQRRQLRYGDGQPQIERYHLRLNPLHRGSRTKTDDVNLIVFPPRHQFRLVYHYIKTELEQRRLTCLAGLQWGAVPEGIPCEEFWTL